MQAGPATSPSWNTIPSQMKIPRNFATFPLLLSVALGLAPGAGFAQGELMDQVGQLDVPGAANGVFVQGEYAYLVTAAPGSLLVIYVSDPTNPDRVGATNLGSGTDGYALYVQGDYAYLGTDYWDLVYDVSDPANPAWVGQYNASLFLAGQGIYVSGSLAYVAHGRDFVSHREGRFRIFNVSDPGSPSLISEIPFEVNFVYDVYVVGDVTAYLAIETAGIEIWDVTTPAAPDSLGSLDTPGTAYGIQVVGDIAYVADGLSGLRLIDISNPTAPAEVGFYDTPGTAQDVFVQGDLAYLADGVAGIRVFDVRDQANPVEVGSYNTPGDARDIFVANDLIYVADGGPGLSIYRLRTATVSLPPGATSIIALEATSLTGLAVQSFQFVLSYPDTLIDSAEAFLDPTLGGLDWELQWQAVPGTLSVAAAGSDTLSGTGSLVGLIFYRAVSILPGVQAPVNIESFMFNEGDPLAFTESGPVNLRFGYGDVSENGAITAFDAALIFDYLLGRKALTPVQLRKAEMSADGTVTALDASLVLQFVVGRIDSFPVEFASPPLYPATGELALPSMIGAPGDTVQVPVELINGTGIYAGSFLLEYDQDALELLGLESGEPLHGALLDANFASGVAAVQFAAAEAVAGSGTLMEAAFLVREDAPPITPLRLRNIRLNEEPVVAVGDSGEIVLSTTDLTGRGALPWLLSLHQNYPNPFNPTTMIRFVLPERGHVSLEIFNLRGQKVASLLEEEFAPGFHTAHWQPQDLSSGIYIYRLQAGNRSRVRKMLLLH